MHPVRTPLASDVDFGALAEKYDDVSGGDIRNAVLKAALAAAAEPGCDADKRIAQRQELRELQRRLVGPLQIVDEQHQRQVLGGSGEEIPDVGEQKPLTELRRQLQRRRHVGKEPM